MPGAELTEQASNNPKEAIGRELHLHEAPEVSTVKVTHDGAEALRPFIETPMQALGIELSASDCACLGSAMDRKALSARSKAIPALAIQID